MTERETGSRPADYARLGFVANPFPPIDEAAGPLWRQLMTRTAANALLSGALRAGKTDPSLALVVTTHENIPEDYTRAALNDFLRRSAEDPSLGTMALNIPLSMMRLGRVRGTLAEVAELLAAVDLEKTIAAYLVAEAAEPDDDLMLQTGVTEAEVADAIAAFVSEPEDAVVRIFGRRSSAPQPTRDEESDALHEVYLRGSFLDPDPTGEQEGAESVAEPVAPSPAIAELDAASEPDDVFDLDEALRDYFVSHVRTHLSTVVGRALASYRDHGPSIFAQELKVTKAPRKTLGAMLAFMHPRWPNVVVLYDNFDAWAIIDDPTKADIVEGMNELNGIIGRTGVMGLILLEGQAPELEEGFPAGVGVDWAMPELSLLRQGPAAFDAGLVQGWLDAAALSGVSALRADGPELAPLVHECADDVLHFACMAEAAIRDAAERGASELDETSIAAGIASVTVTEADR